MLRVALAADAHTLIGENVPNLLSINGGRDFQSALDALKSAGFPYVAWRVLNARAFGLPQERRRLFIVASKHKDAAWGLHAPVPEQPRASKTSDAYGFYWTAGKRSLCFSQGYVPALKIGAADEHGRAPVAVFQGGRVRKLSTKEFLILQGFADLPDTSFPATSLLRMAGNAVPLPMGRFVMSAVMERWHPDGFRDGFGVTTESGFDDGITWMVRHATPQLVSNLHDFLDPSGPALSPQACAGLLVRSVRSGQKMPVELFDALLQSTHDRSGKLRPSRANSFESLTNLEHQLFPYRATLPSISQLGAIEV